MSDVDFENILDEKILRSNMVFISLYISVFENFSYLVKDRVKSFLCDETIADGKGGFQYIESTKYINNIKERKIDGKKVGILNASVLWFVEMGAITFEEYDKFRNLKEIRNKYVHEMSSVFLTSVMDDDSENLLILFNLYKKMDKWWINEIEIPISGSYRPDEYDSNAVESDACFMFECIFDVLYADKSKEYLDTLKSMASH